jgi:hypothetical protein
MLRPIFGSSIDYNSVAIRSNDMMVNGKINLTQRKRE